LRGLDWLGGFGRLNFGEAHWRGGRGVGLCAAASWAVAACSLSLSLSPLPRGQSRLDEGSQPCNARGTALIVLRRAPGWAPEMTAEPSGVCAVGEWGGGEDRNKRGRWLARLQQRQQLVGIVCARRHCFVPLFRNQASGSRPLGGKRPVRRGAAPFVPCARAPAPVPRNRGGGQEVRRRPTRGQVK